MTSPTTIKRLRELLEKASPGEWTAADDSVVSDTDTVCICYADGEASDGSDNTSNDATLIAEMKRHLPALLDRVEAMERTTEDFKLPCDVKLENGTRFHKGVPLSTLILGLQRRAAFEAGAKASSHGGEG